MKTTTYSHNLPHFCIRDLMPDQPLEKVHEALDELCQLATDWFHRHEMRTDVSWKPMELDRDTNPDGTMIEFRLTFEVILAEPADLP